MRHGALERDGSPAAAPRPRWPLPVVYLGLMLLALTAAGLSLVIGHGDLSDASLRGVFLRLRGARLGGAFLAGSALAVAGVLVQGLFRNPLASPSVIGTSTAIATTHVVKAQYHHDTCTPSARPATAIVEMYSAWITSENTPIWYTTTSSRRYAAVPHDPAVGPMGTPSTARQ